MAASAVPLEPARTGLMQNRTFLSIWAGHAISVLGDGFHAVALGLWVLQTTGSGTAMATIMTIRITMGILLGAIAGTFVDRTNRRALMIATDLIRFVLVLGVAYLVGGRGSGFAAVAALTAIIAMASTFFTPAFQASLVNIVAEEDVPRASGLLQMTNVLAQVAGPLLGGMVAGLAGGRTALLVDAASFLVSAVLILAAGRFASPRREREARASFLGELKEGVRFMTGQPLVRATMVLAPVLNFLATGFVVLLPVIAVRIWLVSPTQYGMLEGSFPLGFAVGAGLVMAFATRLRHKGWWILGCCTAAGLLMAAGALMPTVTLALPVGVGAGVNLGITNVLVQAALQTEVPKELQGRVFGALGSLENVASPVAAMAAGIAADLINPVLIASLSSLLLAIVAAAYFFISPALRNYA